MLRWFKHLMLALWTIPTSALGLIITMLAIVVALPVCAIAYAFGQRWNPLGIFMACVSVVMAPIVSLYEELEDVETPPLPDQSLNP